MIIKHRHEVYVDKIAITVHWHIEIIPLYKSEVLGEVLIKTVL